MPLYVPGNARAGLSDHTPGRVLPVWTVLPFAVGKLEVDADGEVPRLVAEILVDDLPGNGGAAHGTAVTDRRLYVDGTRFYQFLGATYPELLERIREEGARGKGVVLSDGDPDPNDNDLWHIGRVWADDGTHQARRGLCVLSVNRWTPKDRNTGERGEARTDMQVAEYLPVGTRLAVGARVASPEELMGQQRPPAPAGAPRPPARGPAGPATGAKAAPSGARAPASRPGTPARPTAPAQRAGPPPAAAAPGAPPEEDEVPF